MVTNVKNTFISSTDVNKTASDRLCKVEFCCKAEGDRSKHEYEVGTGLNLAV